MRFAAYRFADHARRLIATLWVGSIWTIGYLVAPTLFGTLSDWTLAGTIAASMFRTEAFVSLACGSLLLLSLLVPSAQSSVPGTRSKTLFLLVAVMLACTVVMHFGIQPYMAALRATSGAVLTGAAKSSFGMLHGASSLIYLLQSLLGLVLILKIRDSNSPSGKA